MDQMVDLSFYKGKKIFITGHTGFKGSWLSKILINIGAEVTGFSLTPKTTPNLYEMLNLSKKTNSIIGDIRDLELLRKAVEENKPDIVFHLAAQPLVRESYSNPVDTYSTNVMGTVNLLEACRNVKSIRSIVNVTTDKVYLNREWDWGYRENEELCGFDPYSNSKSCSELVTYSYKNCFFNYAGAPAISTARSGNVIGGGDFSEDRIIPDCVRSAMERKCARIRNPFSTRPYQHVLDCLSGYLLLAFLQYNNTKLAGSYNFGPYETDCVTTGTLADKFCKFWGDDANWKFTGEANAPHEANFLKLDISKSKNLLGWSPSWNIDKAIASSVEWYKAYSESGNIVNVIDKQINEFFNKRKNNE